MFTYLCFIILALLKPKYKSYTRKSADWFFTKTHKHCNEHDLILCFHFLFKLTKTEVLMYIYILRLLTYSYKNVILAYAANLHERPAGVIHHKLNASSFQYTTDCVTSFSFT